MSQSPDSSDSSEYDRFLINIENELTKHMKSCMPVVDTSNYNQSQLIFHESLVWCEITDKYDLHYYKLFHSGQYITKYTQFCLKGIADGDDRRDVLIWMNNQDFIKILLNEKNHERIFPVNVNDNIAHLIDSDELVQILKDYFNPVMRKILMVVK